MPIKSVTTNTTRTLKADRAFSPPGLNLRPSTFGIAQRLYHHVKHSRQERKQTRVYASGIKNCARQQAMAIMDFPKEESAKQQENPHWNVVADFGSSIHELVERWLKELGISINSEFRVTSQDEALSGRVDHHISIPWLAFPEPDSVFTAQATFKNKEAILDVKTIGDKDFKEGAWGTKIPGYVAQISVYGRIVGVDTGVILLVNRGTGEMLDIEFDIDTEYADKLLRRASGIADWAAEHRLPPAEEWTGTEGSFTCQTFCPFYKLCLAENISTDDTGKGRIQRRLDAGEYPRQITLDSL